MNDERAVEQQAAAGHDRAVETGHYGTEQLLGLLLNAYAVDQLGGRVAVAADAPASSVVELDGPTSGGLILRFAVTPATVTPERQRRALDDIKPLTPVHRALGEPPARFQAQRSETSLDA